VIPRRPTERTLEFEASVGSFDTTRFNLYGSEVSGPLRVSVEGAKVDTDGYTIVKESRRGRIDRPADSHNGTASGRAELTLSPDLDVFVTGGYFGEERNNGTDLQENDTALGWFTTGGSLRTADGSTWRLTLGGQLESFTSTFSAQADDRNSETLALRQLSPSRMAMGALTWTRTFGNHTLLAGIDSRYVRGETDEKVFVAGRFARDRIAGGQQMFVGAFVQDAWKVAPWLEVTGALRGDWWQAYDGFRRDTPPPAGIPSRQAFDDVDYFIPSPRLAALVHVTPATDVFGSVYQGFRVPTPNELYRLFRVRNDVTVANEKLRPERLTGGEAGVEQRWGVVDARVTGFWNEVQEQILNVTLAAMLPDCPAGTTCRQRQNVELTRIRGVETEIEVRPFSRWRLTLAHIYLDARVADAPTQRAIEGNRLAQVPDHVVTLAVHWADPAWFDASVLVRRVGRQFEDDQNTLPLGAFTTVDARISRQLGRNVRMYVAVENLLDETYAVARTSEGVVSIGTPRMVHGGVRLGF
jgi:outer membrane receptor protein involved in Fe transport